MQDICMLLTWIIVKYCSALLRDLAGDKCDREAALALSGGRSVLCMKGNEEGKLITSHFHPLFLRLCLSFSSLCHYTLKLSFIVSLPNSPIHCLQSSPLQNLFPPATLCLAVALHRLRHVSFKPIKSVYVVDVVHMNISLSWCFPCTSSQPGISLRIYQSFRSALLYGGSANTEVNRERQWGGGDRESGKKRETDKDSGRKRDRETDSRSKRERQNRNKTSQQMTTPRVYDRCSRIQSHWACVSMHVWGRAVCHVWVCASVYFIGFYIQVQVCDCIYSNMSM